MQSTTRNLGRSPCARTLLCVLGLAFCVLAAGCYERKQSVVLNVDGSGRVTVETDVAVPAADGPGRGKPTPLSFGRQVAADFINNTKGVDAWSDVAVTATADGRAHIAATAYFPDINLLHFDMPLEFTWKRGEAADTFILTVVRTRQDMGEAPATAPAGQAAPKKPAMTADQVKQMVTAAKSQYKEQQAALRTQLDAFKLQMNFILPGEVAATHLFSQQGQTVTLSLDGKKVADALDKFMTSDQALAATFEAGEDLPTNDDFMLQSMFNQNGPAAVTMKVPSYTQPAFDYKSESGAAKRAEPAMFEKAGVVLVGSFTVKPPGAAGK